MKIAVNSDSSFIRIISNPITLIMLLSAWLRFGHLTEIPYTHDEYSSLIRMDYSSYQQMIDEGVRTDSHPAGLYSFLRIYVDWFGSEPWVVKLPFLIMSLLSVWLVYVLGKKWFGEASGWVGAAMLGLLAFPVSHSLVARMYTPGILFGLLAALFFTRLILQPKGNRWANVFGLAVSLALCAYSHYFAALLCVWMWLMGWMFVKKEQVLTYLTAPAIAALFFLPHLSVTLDQLTRGGIPTVLGTPDIKFVFHHLSFVASFSWGIGLPLLVLLGITLFRSLFRQRLAVFSLVLWLGPFATGYAYSVLNSPVLQDRALLFGLPFLGIFLGAGLGKIDKKYFGPVAVGLLLFLALVWQDPQVYPRYGYMLDGEHDGVLKQAMIHNSETSIHLLAYKQEILDYEVQRQGAGELQIINPDSTWSLRKYKQVIRDQSPNPISFSWTTQYYRPPWEVMALLRDEYGQPSTRVHFPIGEYFQFGGEENCIDPYREISRLDEDERWVVDSSLRTDSSLHFTEDNVYGITFQDALLNVADHPNDRIFFSVEGIWPTDSQVHLVMELVCGEESVFWNAVKLGEYGIPENRRGTAHICLPVYDAIKGMKAVKLRTYIWNKEREEISLNDARIWSDGGNYMMYALDHALVSVNPSTHFAK